MDITIIGTGNMARGIATRALAGGHAVTLLGTERAKAEALAKELAGAARAGQVGDPLTGDVVVLAVWYQAVPDVLARYGDQLAGKVVVDITNPVDPDTYAPLSVAAGSVAQEIAGAVPGAKVVKAFNTSSPAPSSWARWPGRRWTCSWPAMTTRPRARWRSSPPTAACARSTSARSRWRTSSRAPATSTWPSSPPSAPTTRAR